MNQHHWYQACHRYKIYLLHTGIRNWYHAHIPSGFPVGINVLVSDRIGYSVEVTPFLKAAGGSSKTSNVLIHPGLLFRYPHGFTFTTRLAFETSGRYGCTAIFSKVVVRSKLNNYFIAVPLPFRFGNNLPASAGIGFQLGVTF